MIIRITMTEASRHAAARVDIMFALAQLARAMKKQTDLRAAQRIRDSMDALERALKALATEFPPEG
jgi:hypothetical protein